MQIIGIYHEQKKIFPSYFDKFVPDDSLSSMMSFWVYIVSTFRCHYNMIQSKRIIYSDVVTNIAYSEGILPKGPYLPCVSMAGGALLAGYPRY